MSITTIISLVTGTIFAMLWAAAQKKHTDFNTEIASKPLPEESNAEEVTPEVEDEDARKAYIIEQKMDRAYEIWALRKKVIPIGLSISLIPVVLFFLTAKYVGADLILYFGGLVLLCFVGGAVYLLAELGSKNQQYSLIIKELQKEGYKHSELKEQFERWYLGIE